MEEEGVATQEVRGEATQNFKTGNNIFCLCLSDCKCVTLKKKKSNSRQHFLQRRILFSKIGSYLEFQDR